MTADAHESPVAEGVRSLEVRWIFPGQLEAAVAGWFGRFPARTESREDTYLLDPRLRGLSVKIRGGGALEVKVYQPATVRGNVMKHKTARRSARPPPEPDGLSGGVPRVLSRSEIGFGW